MELLKGIQNWFGKTAGNVAVSFALGALAMTAAGGGAIDYARKINAKSGLQAAADNAATAAARQLQLSGANIADIKAIAASYVKAGVKDSDGPVSTNTVVDKPNGTVDVTVKINIKTPFFDIAGLGNNGTVTATSRARILGGLPLCVLALEETKDKSIAAYSKAKLTATGCSMHSNSISSKAIEAWGNSELKAGMTCSAGGAAGGSANYTPAAVTDCPRVPDPLKDRIAPSVTGCDFTNFEIDSGTHDLQPGTYCGGLKIYSNTVANFLPGIYIIKDGKFEADAQSTLSGTNVGFFFTGANAQLAFNGQTSVSFTGRKDGNMAGLLFFEDPNQPANLTHQITSPNVTKLEGTIYFPKGTFHIASNPTGPAGTVAAGSAYTVIITKFLLMTSGPNLVLNTDYASSQVPVPTTIARMSGDIILAR